MNDTARATPPASPIGETRPHRIHLTSDPAFWEAIKAAQAFHLVRTKRVWTVSDLVGPALQALRSKTGAMAAGLIGSIDLTHKSRAELLRLDPATVALVDTVAEHLLATNARRETARDRKQRRYWVSNRPVVLVALYAYGLGCRAQLISVYGKATAVQDILNETLR